METAMKRLLVASALATCVVMPAFSADTFTFDPEYTIPVFEVGHLGFTTQRGRFDKMEGKATVDFAAKSGKVEFTVFTNSLDMGSRAWTVHVSSEGLFNIEKYPTMVFKSDKLIFDSDKVVAADGQFTLLGVTKPLTVNVNHFACAPNPLNSKFMCAADIAATIKRSDFGMTKYIPTVSDEIRISVPVEAYRDH
jgi:polyisoprenoid-binding protein YceI